MSLLTSYKIVCFTALHICMINFKKFWLYIVFDLGSGLSRCPTGQLTLLLWTRCLKLQILPSVTLHPPFQKCIKWRLQFCRWWMKSGSMFTSYILQVLMQSTLFTIMTDLFWCIFLPGLLLRYLALYWLKTSHGQISNQILHSDLKSFKNGFKLFSPIWNPYFFTNLQSFKGKSEIKISNLWRKCNTWDFSLKSRHSDAHVHHRQNHTGS